ncbi:unnamed protein product [Toxocara canis]|uniref:RT_RNaseH_2 domain-containing protein n=1 Tax=Toxocara canis TaxID=6265 RepID=A0A183U0K1_TOXCA|nr:unnamed protein product [Toxocara canis]
MIFNTNKYDECPATKQQLAYMAEFYEPLGLLTPATLSLKLSLQQLWKKEYDCDQPFDNTDRQNAETPLERFQGQSLKLTRQLAAERDKQRAEIHVFMDASKDVYAAVAYLRFYKENRYESSLLMSRSTVAPTRGITIPRLELMAVLIGSRLLRFVQEQLKHTGPLFRCSFGAIRRQPCNGPRPPPPWIASFTIGLPKFAGAQHSSAVSMAPTVQLIGSPWPHNYRTRGHRPTLAVDHSGSHRRGDSSRMRRGGILLPTVRPLLATMLRCTVPAHEKKNDGEHASRVRGPSEIGRFRADMNTLQTSKAAGASRFSNPIVTIR